jgi:TonB-dependent receptor
LKNQPIVHRHPAGIPCLVPSKRSAIASAVLLLAAVSAAQAQDAAQTVTVTGIRRGIESAISVKKNSDNIVESISAEDIGKLPDSSIAESIARLPGLAAQRVAGRAQVISVRGLSPDFATTLLNGREMVSTGDNRSVEFDQYPSELLSGLTVYKTPDAGLIGQGLSGTLDMQTVRPLSFGGRAIAVNLRGERNSLGAIANAKASGNRASVSYIDQFADRTVGIALGFAHLDSPILDHEFGAYEPWSKVNAGDRAGVPAGTFTTNGAKILARSGKNTRDGFMGVLEWKPGKDWISTLDVYSSTFKRVETANQFEVNLGNYPAPAGFTSNNINANNTLVGSTISSVYPLVRGMYYDRKDKIDAIGLNNKFKLADVGVVADISHSKTSKDELSLENNTQLQAAGGGQLLDTVTYNVAGSGFPTLSAGMNYSDPTKLHVGPTIYGAGYGKRPHVEDELTAFKLVGALPAPGLLANAIADFNFGINYSDRTKKKRQPEGGLSAPGTPTISSDLLYSPTNLSFAGGGIIPTWNVPGVVAKYFDPFSPSETAASYLVQKAWDVTERITTTFLKANIDSTVGGMHLGGNVGLQVVHTDQSSFAHFWDQTASAGNNIKPVTSGKTYNDVLPALNLSLDLGNDQKVRLGLAKQLARPRLDQLSAAVDFGVNTTTGVPGASGGNPKLDPWRANALDLSYEKYFGTKAYLAAAFFYKDLKSYIYQQSSTFDFSKYVPGTVATTPFGQLSGPFNGQGGKLLGTEWTASFPLKQFTPVLDGFGVQASISFNQSRIKIQDPNSNIGSDITLPGLSKRVSNLTFYYEKAGFEARISQRRRSDFVGEIANFANDRTLRYVVGENIVDCQVGYTFNEGQFKGLGLLLQLNNMNDAPYKTYGDTKDRVYEYQKYGRTMLFGANYKF